MSQWCTLRRYLSGVARRGELKAAMRSLGFETKNPTIFQMIADLDQDGGAGMSA